MLGWAILLCGVGGAFASLGMQVTAGYSSTLNIGLLQNQEMAFDASLVVVLVGAMVLVGDRIVDNIRAKPTTLGTLDVTDG